MPKKTKMIRVQQVAAAWELIAPEKSFGGYTLEQFKAKVKPSFDLRDKLSGLDNEFVDAKKRLDDADQQSHDAALLVVNAVKGDPEHGENSPLYATMGYVRKLDRQSGLKRNNAQDPTPPTLKVAA